ncbi:DUF86 domain-containing protein [Burkholderia gladioli]|uniref:DUF86 domain-containing protein n=1 Tax=Burkholderia gladioli TaxID=28095 RepID=UPI001E2C8BB7|nr:DUF86 domain-containing protein [Burkholderia gladioli]
MVVAKSRQELCAFIADSIHTIVHGHIQGYDFSSFKVDPRAQDAVIYRLAVIGETANLLLKTYPGGNRTRGGFEKAFAAVQRDAQHPDSSALEYQPSDCAGDGRSGLASSRKPYR